MHFMECNISFVIFFLYDKNELFNLLNKSLIFEEKLLNDTNY